MVTCKICDSPTANDATRRCDRCWELERRILADPQLARQILARIDAQDGEPRPHGGRECDCVDDADCQAMGCRDCGHVAKDGDRCETCGSRNLVAFCIYE